MSKRTPQQKIAAKLADPDDPMASIQKAFGKKAKTPAAKKYTIKELADQIAAQADDPASKPAVVITGEVLPPKAKADPAVLADLLKHTSAVGLELHADRTFGRPLAVRSRVVGDVVAWRLAALRRTPLWGEIHRGDSPNRQILSAVRRCQMDPLTWIISL
jgi:hypothetical protein